VLHVIFNDMEHRAVSPRQLNFS